MFLDILLRLHMSLEVVNISYQFQHYSIQEILLIHILQGIENIYRYDNQISLKLILILILKIL